MPNPSNPFAPLQSMFAPWLSALPTTTDPAKLAEAIPIWGPAFEQQARLWAQFIETQRKFWTFYNPLLQGAPVFLNGETKTVAEDEAGLEPAETVDGIPDAFELQARTWNHFLDANRSFWTAMNWQMPGVGLPNGAAQASNEGAAAEDDEVEEEEPVRSSPRRASPARKSGSRAKR